MAEEPEVLAIEEEVLAIEEEEEKRANPLVIDINDWDRRPWYTRIYDVNIHLEAKGFVTLKTGLKNQVKARVRTEVEELKSFGALDRIPKEALPCLLSETNSCWSMTLGPREQGENLLAQEAGLREMENHLHLIGDEIGVASHNHMGYSLARRIPMRVHHSKMPGERGAPGMHDLLAAEAYMLEARQKRLVLLYYLGPGKSTLTLTPRDDVKGSFEVSLQEECLLVYRSDRVQVALSTEKQVIIIQMDFLARTRQAVIARSKELLPTPEAMDRWYYQQLKDRVRQERLGDDLPYHIKHEAVRLYGKGPEGSKPVRVVQFSHDLPTLPNEFTGKAPPFEAAVIGGLDCVTEIRPKPLVAPSVGAPQDWGARWDMSEYYDEDPKRANDFKMYTRHMSVFNRGHNEEDDFDILDLKISTMENQSLDPKHRRVAESVVNILRSTNVDHAATQGQDVGYYVGISGNSDQYFHFLQKDYRIGKFTWNNMSNAALVSRLSYITATTGPCIAVDTEDSSGLGAVDTAVRDLRTDRATPFAVASAVSSFTNPFQLIVLCAAQLISKTGRSRVYDSSCDGYVKGEGVISTFLELGDYESRAQDKNIPKGPLTGSVQRTAVGVRCLIMGSACNAQGQSSSLGIQTAPAMKNLLGKCCKDAGTPYSYIDGVEADASGRKLPDLIELGVLMNQSVSRDADATQVALRSHKSNFGNLGPCSGLVAICKSAMLLEKGLHGPTIHLRQFIDIGSIPEEKGQPPSRLYALTEAIEAKAKQTISVNSFSSTGTNLSVMLQGRVPEEDFLITKLTGHPIKTAGKPIYWWPGGEQKALKKPMRGYFIVGSWTNWEYPIQMEEEEEGVFGYTLTMGENNWETFQIWVDEDEDQVIHPVKKNDVKNTKPSMPEQCSKSKCWLIDGRSQMVRLVNEEQMKANDSKNTGEEYRVDPMLKGRAVTYAGMCSELQDLTQLEHQRHWNELEEPQIHEKLILAYRDNCVPIPSDRNEHHVPAPHDQHGNASNGGVESMPLISLNYDDAAKPGDKFRVRLHIRGKYRRVEWSKVRASSNTLAVVDAVEEYTHKYKIIGDHNYWTFEDMEPVEAEQGLFTTVIHLLKDTSSFQVYRDGDWEQGFFPERARGQPGDKILGPNGDGMGLNWKIDGKVGDLVRVSFRRNMVEGESVKTMTWQKEGFKEVDFEAISKQHKWHVIGSFTDFRKTLEMEKDGETENYKLEITVGKSGKETFQFLLDGNFLSALHPECSEATMHDETQSLAGPDDEGSGKYWVIGLHPQDTIIGAGTHVFIHLDVEGGLPKRVWWEIHNSPDAHREYLAQGCWNTFDRHCRMLGFKPYQNADNPARQVAKPAFVSMTGSFVHGPQIP